MRPGTVDVRGPGLNATHQHIKQTAVKKALAGLPVHKVGNGKFTVPVLQPRQDGLPFSMSLDLYQSNHLSSSSSVAERPDKDIFSLQYVLDGTGQVSLSTLTNE